MKVKIDLTTREGNKILLNLLEKGLIPTIDMLHYGINIEETINYDKT